MVAAAITPLADGHLPLDPGATAGLAVEGGDDRMSITTPIGLKGAIESFHMYDPLGNCAASALFKTGETTFEVYFWDFNDCTPRRTIGNAKPL